MRSSIIACTLALVGCADDVTVRGRLVDTDRAPLAGWAASACCRERGLLDETVTDSDGRYSLSVDAPDAYGGGELGFFVSLFPSHEQASPRIVVMIPPDASGTIEVPELPPWQPAPVASQVADGIELTWADLPEWLDLPIEYTVLDLGDPVAGGANAVWVDGRLIQDFALDAGISASSTVGTTRIVWDSGESVAISGSWVPASRGAGCAVMAGTQTGFLDPGTCPATDGDSTSATCRSWISGRRSRSTATTSSSTGRTRPHGSRRISPSAPASGWRAARSRARRSTGRRSPSTAAPSRTARSR